MSQSIKPNFSLPVVIIIPAKPIPDPTSNQAPDPSHWGTKGASIYYVPNNLFEPQDIMDAKGGLDMTKAFLIQGDLHTRGGSTLSMPKQQFEIELTSEPASGNFLGMTNGGKKWVFNDCGVIDFTLLRNALAFNLQSSLGQYAPQHKYFELFLCQNTADITKLQEILDTYYHGLYVNMDKICIDSKRVNIPYDKKDPTANSALIQINGTTSTKYLALPLPDLTANVFVWEPDLEDIGKATDKNLATELENWFFDPSASNQNASWAGFYNNLYGNYILKNVAIPSTAWADQVCPTDYQSFAVYLILNELAKDPDGYHRSCYMYKNGNTAFAGPLWDKNKSFGNTESEAGYPTFTSTTEWAFNRNPASSYAPVWWIAMIYDQKFSAAIWNIWKTQYKSGVSGALSYNMIQTYLNMEYSKILTSGALARDAIRWNTVNQSGGVFSSTAYLSEFNTLTTYLQNRLLWMDQNMKALVSLSGYTPD